MKPVGLALALAVGAVALALAAPPAAAATRRIAVVVGNNVGSGARPDLRFAEADADKVARVLAELGDVAPPDLIVLRGAGVGAVRDVLGRVAARIAALRRVADDRVVLIFYFSGHSDGVALELGQERLGFRELRERLVATGADVRLTLVDSCRSGALLALKGGSLGPAFEIRLDDTLASSGEALLTSSAADESALESREIGGSFFTHHLVSGMRGPADASGDGLITLTEAYRYAYGKTLATTGATVFGPQHPTYAFRLAGTGELILTGVARTGARLELPADASRALIVDLARGQVIAELGADARTGVVLPAGRYQVRAWRGERSYLGRVDLARGQTARLGWDAMAEAPLALAHAKGDADLAATASPARGGLALAAAFALTPAAIADGVAGQLGVALGVAGAAPAGFGLTLALASGAGDGVRETTALVRVDGRLGLRRGRVTGWAGASLGAGAVWQSVDGAGDLASPLAVAGPGVGAAIALGGHLALTVDAWLLGGLVRREGAFAVAPLPTFGLGLGAAP